MAFSSFFLFALPVHAAVIRLPTPNLGLVGYWPMNENSGTQAGDFSGNGNNGTLTNGPTWTSGKRGGAVSFDGVDDYVGVPNSSVYKPSGELSVCFWMYANSIPSDSGIIQVPRNYDGGGNYIASYMFSFLTPGKLQFYINKTDPSAIQADTLSTLNTNTWYQVCGTYSKSAQQVFLYVNGLATSTTAITPTPDFDINYTGADALNIGKSKWGTFSITNSFFPGKIDDVRIYNRALTATEVATLYRSGQITRKQVSNSGLVGFWPLDDATSTQASDMSGNGNNGTLTNSPTWVSGKHAGAVSFDGVDDYVRNSAPVNLPLGSQARTSSLWFKVRSFGPKQALLQYGGFPTTHDTWIMNITVSPSNVLEVGTYNDSYTSTFTPTLNQWYHFVGVYDGGTNIDSYVNGILIGSHTMSGAANTTLDSTGINLGAWQNAPVTNFFDGLIDDVRIYNRALSATEINNLYHQGQVTIGASQAGRISGGLVGYWSFNGYDMTPTTAYDRSGQGNNGTLTNGPTPTIGKVGQALSFDGGDDYVDLVSPDSLDNIFATGGTLSAWVKVRTASVNTSRILDKEVTGDGWLFGIYDSGGSLFPTLNQRFTGADGRWNADSSISRNEWANVAVVYDRDSASNDPLFYINGQSITTTEAVSPGGSAENDSSLSLRLGNDSVLTRGFDGPIDEVRIYNRALSAAEVKQLYLMGK